MLPTVTQNPQEANAASMDEPVQQVTTPAGDPAWQVRGYESVKALLADPRLGRSHPQPEKAARFSESVMFGQATGSPDAEGAGHAWMRKLLTPAFSARRMSALRPRVQELADGLFDQMARHSPPADFHELVSFQLPVLVICELLGVPYEDRGDFRRWSDDAADMNDRVRSSAGLGRLREYMGGLLESKRREPGEDVLSDLARVQEQFQGAFRNDDVTTLAAGLLFAGHETTVAAIDRGMVLLLTNPAQRAALVRDPSLVPGVVEEVLRSPDPAEAPRHDKQAGGVPRWAKEDIDVEGVTIRAGDLVLLSLQDANQDDRVFSNPRVFDPSRATNQHMTFGYGPHFCIGAPLARIELQTVFGTVFLRFPGLALAAPIETLRSRSNLLTGGLTHLPVTW
jgi:pentalenolactone synthase